MPAHAEATPWHTPAAGTYRFHYERMGPQPEGYDSTDVVALAKGGYTDTRDHRAAKLTRSYTTQNATLRETAFSLSSASGVATCKWNKPILVAPSDASPGQTWTSDVTCSMTVGQTKANVTEHSTATVVGIRSAKVGDATVPLLRIDRKVELRTTANGQTGTRTSTFTDYFDTNRGLLAQSTEDARETGPSGTTSYRIVESMLTLQPEVSR